MRILTIQEMEQVGGAGQRHKSRHSTSSSGSGKSSGAHSACPGGSSNKSSSGRVPVCPVPQPNP